MNCGRAFFAGKTNLIEMKTFLIAVGVCFLLSAGGGATTAWAQDSDVSKQQMALEKERLELDKRSNELKQKELELEKARQELQQADSRSLSLNLSGDVLFDYDKAVLKPAAEEALKKVGVVLSLFPDSHVVVEGYTDAKGQKSLNMQLSRERAQAVKDWLVKNGGVAAANIEGKGLGEENPVAPNKNADGSDNPAGRALNRRVSIVEKGPAPLMATPTP